MIRAISGAAILAVIVASVAWPIEARAQNINCNITIPQPPNPVPPGYDWTPLAQNWCNQLAGCIFYDPDCVSNYMAIVNMGGLTNQSGSSGTDSDSTSDVLVCEDSDEYADGTTDCSPVQPCDDAGDDGGSSSSGGSSGGSGSSSGDIDSSSSGSSGGGDDGGSSGSSGGGDDSGSSGGDDASSSSGSSGGGSGGSSGSSGGSSGGGSGSSSSGSSSGDIDSGSSGSSSGGDDSGSSGSSSGDVDASVGDGSPDASNDATTGEGGCFAAGTLIRMADGTERAIETVREGDRVLAYDTSTDALAVSRVSKVFVHATSAELVRVNDGLLATPVHPFRVGDRWVEAGDLSPSEVLWQLSGPAWSVAPVSVSSVVSLPGGVPVYNLEVEGYHDYFAGGFLVHNKIAHQTRTH